MKFSKPEWIIVLVTLLGLFSATLGVGVVVAKMAFRQQASASALTQLQQNVPVVATAKESYPNTEALARTWRADAQLSRVTAAWNSPTESQLLSGQTSWAYYFYSPSTQEMLIISATGQAAHKSRVAPAVRLPVTIPGNYWQIDSTQVIQDFLNHGGHQFLQANPQASVHLQLSVSEQGQVEWHITGLSTPNAPTIQFFLNATSGMVG